MNKINSITHSKKTLSFEIFPPKTDKGLEKLKQTLSELKLLAPDFISCTYGAGGSSRGKTLEMVDYIQNNLKIPAMAHLTCVLHSKEEIREIIQQIKDVGVENILALRGDPPQDQPDWQPGENNFHYSSELAQFIKDEFNGDFSIGVAGFPEGHLLCPNREQDADYLKIKADSGADFVITQLFFDNQDYYDYVARLAKRNVSLPVLPGILPITNYEGLLKFTKMCGASVPEKVHQIFKPIKDDPEQTLQAGINYCVEQCQDLLANNAPGIHFYCLNKISPVREIVEQIQSSR